MSVEKMKLVKVIGKMEVLASIIKANCDTGYFHPESAIAFLSITKGIYSLNEENPYSTSLSRLKTLAKTAQQELLMEEASADISKEDIKDYIQKLDETLGSLYNRKQNLQDAIQQAEESILQFQHFTGLDLDLDAVFACEFTKVRFGRLPKESYQKLQAYSDNPYILFFPCSSDTHSYWGVYFVPFENSEEIDRIFSGLYFQRLRIPSARGTPENVIVDLRNTIAKQQAELDALETEIRTFWEQEGKHFRQVYTQVANLEYAFSLRKYAVKFGRNFFFYVGWIPARQEAHYRKCIESVPLLEMTIDQPNMIEPVPPPTKLRNFRLFRPYEFYVEMFGTPGYKEVDPTPIVAIVYSVLFGIMFGDVGQGIVLSLIGMLMWKLKRMALGPILVRCGFFSTLFGAVYGSLFGFEHALDPLYKAIGLSGKPLEVMSVEGTNNIIMTAIGIGVGLVMLALILSIYSKLKQKRYGPALFGPNGVAGFVLYTSIVVAAVSTMVFHKNLLTLPFVLPCIVLPVLVLFCSEPLTKLIEGEEDWKPESIGEFIMQEFFEVFEYLLSFASNTMSFLRVGGFVLVHAGMMMVVFTLAEMGGAIGGPIILVIGNGVVLLLEGLLVGVQVLRLQFYEMFSRFFEGDGRPFTPAKLSDSTD